MEEQNNKQEIIEITSPNAEMKDKVGFGTVILWILFFPIMLMRHAVLTKKAGWWIFACLLWIDLFAGSLLFFMHPAVIEPIIKTQVTVELPKLSDVYQDYRVKTDIQKKAYRDSLNGQEFQVNGKVKNVLSNGILSLEIEGMDWNDFCFVNGIPESQLMQLNKGDSVKFSAVVYRVTDLVAFGVWLEFNPNYV